MQNKISISENFMKLFILAFISFMLSYCSVFQFQSEVKSKEFNYKSISKAHFTPNNERPFPLTVKRGNSVYNSTTSDGHYLFFSDDTNGNFDILFRDLRSSVIVPVTRHPAAEYKPSISPDGKKLVYVSERYDSEGDLFLMTIDPEKWAKAYLKGERFPNEEVVVLTNPDYKNISKIQRFSDTDPIWSPDSRYIAFSSNRFSPEIPNIALLDTLSDNSIKQITEKGGASPVFSADGTKIIYLSYKDHPLGELYSVDLSSGKEIRLTNDSYMDFSPTVSSNGKFLYFTSIRKDTNKNSKLDERDNSFIMRLEFETGKFVELTAGNLSVFDTKYSNLNDGSIIFTASLDNSLNIYFIPAEGEIPKQENIIKQYDLFKLYRNRSTDYYILAMNAMYLYFENDPLYPVLYSRAERQLSLNYLRDKNMVKYKELLDYMISTKGHPLKGLSYAIAYAQIARTNDKNPSPHLLEYYDELIKIKGIHNQIPPSVIHLAADLLMDQNQIEKASDIFKLIIKEYPNFYRIDEIKRKEGQIVYKKDNSKIPELFIDLMNNPLASGDEKKYIVDDIINTVSGGDNIEKKKALADGYINVQNIEKLSPEIAAIIYYSKAVLLSKQDNFEESNNLIKSYLSSLQKGSFVYLKSRMLRSENYRNLGDVDRANSELVGFIKDYSPSSGVEVQETDLEKFFFYFETKARQFERDNQNKDAIKSFQYNNLLLSLSTENNLPIQKTYKDFAVFYERKMVDSSFDYSRSLEEKSDSSIINKINVLGKNNLNIWGNFTNGLSYVFSPKIFRLFGDFRDWHSHSIIDKEGLKTAETYFQNRMEPARNSLEYGTIFGNSYYLINLAITEEEYYLSENALTKYRKGKILQKLKQAEYDLLWIIYANPSHADAYLLLGWMYQYIDVRKKTIVFPENLPDGEAFESVYSVYFPLKYLEENIELYNQILAFLGSDPNKKVASDIHLNLGNNYFLLNNFQKSLEQYEEVEKLSKYILDRTRFENYKQKAVFYFNFSRAKIYNGKTSEAIPYLQLAIDLYYKNEYFPLLSKIGTKKNVDDLKLKLENIKKKIALLHSLVGLSEMELERYNDAIVSLATAISMNGGSNFVNDISLYNSIAICYQNVGDYRRSELNLKLADKEFRNLKKKKLIDYFKFNIWDSILPDSVRVIGDGRFPGEVPPVFANLITRGIRIANNSERNEFNEVRILTVERETFLKENKIDKTVIGDKIIDNSKIDLAYNEYQRGNYLESAKIYEDDYVDQKKKGHIDDSFKSYVSSNIALFSHIEENSEKTSFLIDKLTKNINFLNKFKDDELNSCREKLPAAQKENMESCIQSFYDEYYDFDPHLGYNYLYLGEAYNQMKEYELAFQYYGYALPLLKNPSNISEEEIGLPEDKFSAKERVRLRLAVSLIFLRIGEIEKFEKQQKEAYFSANEYQLDRELFSSYLIEAEYNYKIQNYKKSNELLERCENILRNSIGLLYNINESLLFNLYNLKAGNYIRLKDYSNLIINREKLYSVILFRQLLINELRFLDKNLFDSLNELQNSVYEDLEYINKIEAINLKRGNSSQLVSLKSKNLELADSLIKEVASYLPKGMDMTSWYYNPKKYIPKLKQDELLVHFYSNGNEFVQIVEHPNFKTRISSFNYNSKEDLKFISDELKKVSEIAPKIKKLVVVANSKMHDMGFNSIPFKDGALNDYFDIRYIFRVSQLERETNTLRARLKRITSVAETKEVKEKSNSLFNLAKLNPLRYVMPVQEIKIGTRGLNLRIVDSAYIKNYLMDTDVLEGPTDFDNKKHFIGEKRKDFIHMKDIVEDQWNIPLIVINNYSSSRISFIKVGFLYDILQFAGVQSIILLNKEQKDKFGKEFLSKIENANNFIKEKRIMLVGEHISEYVENNNIFESEYKKYSELGVSFERRRKYLESIRNFLQANSLLPDNRPDLLIDSELNIARLKTKNFPNKNYLLHYEDLLLRFPANSIEEEKILYSSLLVCYESSINVNCDNYYNRYQVHPLANEDRKFIVSYYKSLKEGNLKVIDPQYDKFIKTLTNEDPFLKNMKLAYLFSKGFIWDKALFHAKEAIKYSSYPEEKEASEIRLEDIEYEIYFIKGIYPENNRKDRVYFFATNRIWDIYKEKAKKSI